MRKVVLLAAMLFGVVLAQYLSWRAHADITVLHEQIADNPTHHYVPPTGSLGTVIVAHGFSGNKTMMRQWGFVLARAGFDVYVFDQPGHGEHPNPLPPVSSGLADNPLGANLAAIAGNLIGSGRAEVGRIALVGHSMGSTTVIAGALQDKRLPTVVAVSFSGADLPAGRPANMLFIAAERDTPAVLKSASGADRPVEIAPGRNHITVVYDPIVMDRVADWIHGHFGTTRPSSAAAQNVGWWWVLLAMVSGIGMLLAVGHMLAPVANTTGSGPVRVLPLTALATMAVAAFSAVLAGAYLRLPGLGLAVADYLSAYFLVMAAVYLALRWLWPREFAFPLSPEPEPFLLSLLKGVGLFLGYAGGVGTVIHMNLSYFVPGPQRLIPLVVLSVITWVWFLQEEAMKRGMHWLGAAVVGLIGRGLTLATWFGAAALPNPPAFLVITIPVAGALLVGLELVSMMLRQWRLSAGAIATFQALVIAWSISATFPVV